VRLDPHSLPIRFAARDPRADGGIRHIELSRDHVVLRRSLRGIPMALNIRVHDFHGIGLRLLPDEDGSGLMAMLVLEHRDPSLAVPLLFVPEDHDIATDWRMWSEALQLPCLMPESPAPTDAHVRITGEPGPRRRRRNAVKARRPSILMRRRPGAPVAGMAIYRDEREIIART
jgi:hypothetical protein